MVRYDKGISGEIPDGSFAGAPLASMVDTSEISALVVSSQGLGSLPANQDRVRTVAPPRFSDVAGIILAGGESSRMGSNKALLKVNGERMVETAYRCLTGIFDEILLVTNTPEVYEFIPCRKVADIYPGMGPLGGIHAALFNCAAERAFITACDMPGLNPRLIRELNCMHVGADVVIPETVGGLEPLHAVYTKNCLPNIEKMLRAGKRRILSCFEPSQIRLVPRERIAAMDSDFSSFCNINTQEEYRRLTHPD